LPATKYFDSPINREKVLRWIQVHGELKGCCDENPLVDVHDETFTGYYAEKMIDLRTGEEVWAHSEFRHDVERAMARFSEMRLEMKPDVMDGFVRQLSKLLQHGAQEVTTKYSPKRGLDGELIYDQAGEVEWEATDRVVTEKPIPQWAYVEARKLFIEHTLPTTGQLQNFLVNQLEALRQLRGDQWTQEQMNLVVEFLKDFEKQSTQKIRALKTTL
jgi:hypothetical protein